MAEEKGFENMSATAPLDVDTEQLMGSSQALQVDDLVVNDLEIITDRDETASEPAVPQAPKAATRIAAHVPAEAERQVIMRFVYLGIVTFLAIIAAGAVLALG